MTWLAGSLLVVLYSLIFMLLLPKIPPHGHDYDYAKLKKLFASANVLVELLYSNNFFFLFVSRKLLISNFNKEKKKHENLEKKKGLV